jgi:hypothetical protein
MAGEVQESSYRKRFPKGKDWKTPKKNPYGFCGLNESSYHGMETVAISIEKYNDLMKDFNIVVTTLNSLFQGDPENEFIKKTLQRVGIIPKGDIH